MRKLPGVLWLGLCLGGCIAAPLLARGGVAKRPSARMAPHQLTIVVIPKGLTHPYWQEAKSGAEAAGKKFNVKIDWNGPVTEGQGVSEQVSIVENAITKKADGIALAPIDPRALRPVINKAYARHIPLVLFDSGAKTRKYLSLVASSQSEGGILAAHYIGRLVGGRGEVGLVPVLANYPKTEARENSFIRAMRQYFPHVRVVRSQYGQSDFNISRKVTASLLVAHPHLKAIFASNEASAIGALNALRDSRRNKKAKLVAFDTASLLTSALKLGDVAGVVVQHPYEMGFESVKAIVDKKEGRRVARRIDAGVTLITRANMNTPQNRQWLTYNSSY